MTHADEVIFYQRVRNQLRKALVRKGAKKNVDTAVRDLVDDSVSSEGVVDIFAAAGIERMDVSILDDRFLQTFRDRPHENLRLKLLERLMEDHLKVLAKRNPPKAKSFQKMLESTLQKYHSRLIDAAAVVKAMIEVHQQTEGDARRAKLLGLEADELAFYDAVVEKAATIYDERFLCDLIHEVVQTIKKNLKVDWTEPHREQVMAEVRAGVRRVLRRRSIKEQDFEPFLQKFIDQAAVLYEDWPLAA